MMPSHAPLRLGWLSTGRGPGSRHLLTSACQAIRRGELAARIEVVFSNREHGEAVGSDEFLAVARSYGLPVVTLSSRRFRREHQGPEEWRDAYTREAVRLLAPYRTDLLVLAGFMLILGDQAWRAYPALNLHPALPHGPEGTWQEVIWQLIAQRAHESGAMVHLATADIDEGPVVAFCRFPIRGHGFDPLWRAIEHTPLERVRAEQGESNPLFRLVREEGVKREVPLLIATLRLFAEGRARIAGGRVVDASGIAIQGHDLTDQIESYVRAGAA